MVALHITPSERTALEYLAGGASASEIARRLGINEPELDAHLKTLFNRMGVASRAEAIAAALRRGLVPT